MFQFIKKMLGFEVDESEFVDESEDNVTITSQPLISAVEKAADSSEIPEPPHVDDAMKARIFEGVVAVFNTSLPDFLKNSVDPEAQRLQLKQALDKSCDDYLNSLLTQATAYAEARLHGAVDAARKESDRLKEEMENVARAQNTMREQKLSADRRSRALTDRVHDLEGQLEKIEAEREQFQLENMSLLNKLRVADVQPASTDSALQEQIEKLTAEKETLVQEREQVLSEKETLAQEKIQVLSEKEALEKELTAMAANFENASKQCEMQEAMYADLQKTLAETKSELEKEKAAGEEAAQKASEELDKAHEVLKNFERLEKQFEGVAEVIRKRDAIIARLKSDKKQLKAENDHMRLQLSNREVSDGLFGFDGAESNPSGISETEVESGVEPLLDDDFEVPEWFVSEPAPVPKEADLQFGYQEPVKKHSQPDNDAQLTLF